MNKDIKSSEKMWRTLVRVVEKRGEYSRGECVYLIVPAFSETKKVWCPKKAIPPFIFRKMRKGSRLHVQCNIGAENPADLCFDQWEDIECVCDRIYGTDGICSVHGRRNKNRKSPCTCDLANHEPYYNCPMHGEHTR